MTPAEQNLLNLVLADSGVSVGNPRSVTELTEARCAVLRERMPAGLLEIGQKLFVESTVARLRWLEVRDRLASYGVVLEGHVRDERFAAWYAEAEAIFNAEKGAR